MKKSKNIIFLARCLLIIICLNPGVVLSQVQLYTGTGSTYNPFGTATVGSFTKVYEVPYSSILNGTPYLNEEWKNADIIFSQDTLLVKDIPVKIDVMNNWLEVKYEEQIYLLYADDTYSFILKDNNDTYITKNALGTNGPSGFFKVLYNEKSSLFCHYSTGIKKANYIPAFNVGDRDDKIIIVKTYYAFINRQLIELEKNKRKFTRQFNSNEEMDAFFRHNKINPKDEQDLIKFIKYYDSK